MKKVESLFEQARTDALSSEEMERLWRNVATAGAVGGMGGGEGAPGTAGRWLGGGYGTALKVIAGLVVAGGITAAVVGGRRAPAAPPAPKPSMAIASPRETEASVPEVATPIVAFDDLPHAHGESPVPARPAHARVEGAVGPSAPSPVANVAAAAPVAEAPAAVATTPVAVAPAAGAPTGSPSEGALLLQARRYLATDPGSALALTDDAARRFPDGPLAPEREVLAIEALAHLGRAAEARARLATFGARYPQSPHLAHLESLVAP